MKVDPYSTHQPLLLAVILKTSGPILEIGGGYYSTPLFGVIAAAQKRDAITLETNAWVYDKLRQFEAPYHRIVFIDGIPFDENGRFAAEDGVDQSTYVARQAHLLQPLSERHERWSVVLIDQAPGFLRRPSIELFANKADFIVVHDSEQVTLYDLTECLASFRHRYDFTLHWPNTSVLSNTEPCEVFKTLPDGPPYVPNLMPSAADLPSS